MLYKAPQAEKPTIILLLDRNALEDQMKRNLESLGIGNVSWAFTRVELDRLLEKDYRGIIVSMIHKFDKTERPINNRKNIYVLIGEAHRTTGGDLGTYLMAAIPSASLIGFTGTPVDKTAFGKGTFKIFGGDDEKGYLDKYSISDSIKDGTTLPLFYALAPNELRVPSELLEKEFLSLAETEGISDIEELNKILQKAVQTKTFLKAHQRVDTVAKYVAKHFKENRQGHKDTKSRARVRPGQQRSVSRCRVQASSQCEPGRYGVKLHPDLGVHRDRVRERHLRDSEGLACDLEGDGLPVDPSVISIG